MSEDVVSPVEQPEEEDIQAQLVRLETEVEEQKNNFLRSMADFKNFKRRTEQEREELIRNASAGLVLKLLPVLDDLLRAMEHIPAEVQNNPWLDGVKQVQRKFELALESQGVQTIAAEGAEFDPNLHEAVVFEEVGADVASNTVVQELQRGYTMGDRVLRPTMVRVSK